MLTQQYLKECLNYCPNTGVFTWLERPAHHFKPTAKRKSSHIRNNWNALYSGHISDCKMRGKHTLYISIGINRKKYLGHRLAWLYVYGEMPDEHIDHINGIGTDNSISNLREASNAKNMTNTKHYTNNTSGIKGVHLYKRTGRWIANIQKDKKNLHLGCFATIEEAANARKKAEIELGYINRA